MMLLSGADDNRARYAAEPRKNSNAPEMVQNAKMKAPAAALHTTWL